jgi:hypothetical protein
MIEPRYAASRVQGALIDLGFVIEREPVVEGGQHADLLARRGDQSYLVEVKHQVPFRRTQFLGAVAHGILELRDRGQRAPGPKPLLAVWVERAKPNAAPEFEAYLQHHAPDLDWLIVDAKGWRKWKIGGEQGEAEGKGREDIQRLSSLPAKSNPFAPRNQWMLKLLLLPGLDERYWGGPSRQPATISALAEAAHVAKSHAWNLVALLERLGSLRRQGDRFLFPGLRRLLEDWCAFVRLRPDKVIGAKPVHPERTPDKAVARLLARLARRPSAVAEPGAAEVVVGGHRACHLLALGRSNIESVRLYVDGAAGALKRLDLVGADEDSAILEIVEPKAKDSVFRGSARAEGLPVADVLQLYLDLRSSAARGVEQSDFLFERVLEPHFRKSGWL